MGQKCLNCGAPIYQPFEPCIDCGMRPTDPALRRQMGKAEYEREQGHHRHALSIKNRSRAAQGLQKDLLHEVPMLYGQNNLWGADVAIGKIHREGMVRKNGGGLPPGVPATSKAKLPMEDLVFFLWGIYLILRNLP
jgi:hypothetical protein